MKKSWIIGSVVAMSLAAGSGCSEKSGVMAELDRDLCNASERLSNPGPYALEFGVSLANRIFSLPDPYMRRRYQAKFERVVLSAVFNTDDYDLRMHQFNAFDTLAEFCMCGMMRWGDPDSINAYMHGRLRLLKRTKREKDEAETKRNCGPIRLGVHVSPGLYAERVCRSLDRRAEDFEVQYNGHCGELTEEQKSMIKNEFALIMERPIRSDEEIARDRQRKIDAEIEEARRRQEERLGNDVRVDIDYL